MTVRRPRPPAAGLRRSCRRGRRPRPFRCHPPLRRGGPDGVALAPGSLGPVVLGVGDFAGAGHSRLLAPGGNRNTSCQARARNPPLTAAMLGQRRSGQLRPPPNCSGRQHCSALSRLMPTATAARLTGQQRRAVWSGRGNSISSPSLPRKPAIPPPRHSTWAHSVRALAVLARSYRRRVQNS